ncbi:MAG TPA: hypothetical protein ENG05_01455 [Acidilobales archaeon]|nr:hypothetical protein [Acidilobales archaeon]
MIIYELHPTLQVKIPTNLPSHNVLALGNIKYLLLIPYGFKVGGSMRGKPSLTPMLASGVNSLAIVGASPIEGKVGYVILKNVIDSGFKGKIYPVNPKHNKILGIKSWPRLSDLPEVPDLVVIAIPPPYVPEVLNEAGSLGVKLAVIITAGFREVGNVKLEEELYKISAKYSMRILGPNSAGITLSKYDVHASIEVLPAKGKVGLVMQSGALGGVVIDRLRKLSSGISFFFSLGNMLDIDFVDALEYAMNDEETESLIAYVEWLRRGREFIRLAKRFTREKPLCIIKGGWGARSTEAVRSHTGGLATNYSIFKAVCKQVRAFLANDLDELVEVCEVLRRIKKLRGNRVLIVTNSGGLGVITASHLESVGIDLKPISSNLSSKLASQANKKFTGRNPIDFGGDATINQVLSSLHIRELEDYYDVVVIVYVPTAAEGVNAICKGIKENVKDVNLPIVMYFDGFGKDDVMMCASRYAPVVSSAGNLALAFKELMKRRS